MASVLFVPEPKTILVIGLGGGTLPMAFHRLFNQTTIHAVEIDTAVVKVAKKYFLPWKSKEKLIRKSDTPRISERIGKSAGTPKVPEKLETILWPDFSGRAPA